MMKIKQRLIILFLGIFLLSPAMSNDEEELSGLVLSALIEKHTEMVHTNLMSEFCSLERYIELDLEYDWVKHFIATEVETNAKLGKLADYSLESVVQLAGLQFRAFNDGVRYGGFMAENLIYQNRAQFCSDKALKAINDKLKALTVEKHYLLKEKGKRKRY